MFRFASRVALSAAGCFCLLSMHRQPASGEDAYFEVPITKLTITEGTLPKPIEEHHLFANWRRSSMMIPYAVLDGPGEVFLGNAVGRDPRFIWRETRERPEPRRQKQSRTTANRTAIAIRVPKLRTVTGTLYVPNRNYDGMARVRFSVAIPQASAKAKRKFYLTKSEHYAMLQRLNVPGGAWFLQQAAQAFAVSTGSKTLEPIESARRAVPDRMSRSELENTFRVFSGGRAISENLQLDRLVRSTKPGPPSVDIKSLRGITVAEMDWTKLTRDIKPKLDPLAKLVPHDQHALFFPSFRAMTKMLDESNSFGTPLLHLMQSRAESARSKERYETQLCLEVNALSRLLGPKVIKSVAFTGSDPYLRTGTDVAVLFEAKSPVLLRQFLAGKHLAARKAHRNVRVVKGIVAGVDYVGVVSPNRRVCSYVASYGDDVVVANSLVQIRRIAETRSGKSKSLASLPEYRFFRHRYQSKVENESAFLMVTDATIRRWCGPKWRIATSRRTRTAAVMAHYQATHLAKLVAGDIKPSPITTNLYVPDLGTLLLANTGVTSSEYGSLEFMTPIAEMDLDTVTKEEAAAYRRWRDSYQRYWRQFFDPIAVKFSVRDDRVSADVTVMPLIDQTDYRDLVQLSTGASIKPQAGDRHAGSLVHWALAVNPKAMFVRRLAGFLPVNPLSWLGDSIAVYADDDPFWMEFAKAKDKDEFMRKGFPRLPLAFRAEVKSGLKLTLFLTGLRTYIDKTVPGMIEWNTRKHNGQPYVQMKATERGRAGFDTATKEIAIYYVATPKALIISMNENVLKRAIERELARSKSKTDENNTTKNTVARPWLGSSVALQVDRKALGFLEAYFGEDYRQMMQARAWANLPVLNEWKRRFPDRDPVKLHETYWGIQLRCPGGGRYTWNEKYQTMASTVYGHPGKPKAGPKYPAPLRAIQSANFGLTFEHKGLRARMELLRGSK